MCIDEYQASLHFEFVFASVHICTWNGESSKVMKRICFDFTQILFFIHVIDGHATVMQIQFSIDIR